MSSRIKVSELATRITSGGTPRTTNSHYYDGVIPWLRTQEVDFNRVYRTEKTITNEGLKNSSAKIIPKNSVIVAMYGATAGKVAINKIDLTTNQACCNIIIDSNIADYEYVYYSLKNEYKNLLNSATGAAQQNLGTNQISNFEIVFHSISKQKQIAKILGDLDRKIELNRRQNETLEQIGQALFKHYFIDSHDTESWETGSLSEVADINAKSVGKDFNSEHINYIDISSVGTDSLDSYQNIKLSESPSRAKRIISRGDILWSTVRPNRRSFVRLGTPKENAIASTGFAVLSPKAGCSGFVYFYTTNQSFTNYLMRRAKGAAYPAVLASDFTNAPILIPPKDVLNEFEILSEPILERKDYFMSESETLSKLRDSLLPKLISGEITV